MAESSAPVPEDGEFLVRNIWMSVDPYMRGRMRDVKSYIRPFQIGARWKETASASRRIQAPAVRQGDYVSGNLGWREYWVSQGKGGQQNRSDPRSHPNLPGNFGHARADTYVGLLRIGDPKAGETVCVSAASAPLAQSSARSPKSKAVVSSGAPAQMKRSPGFAIKSKSTTSSTTRSSIHPAIFPRNRERLPGRHQRLLRKRRRHPARSRPGTHAGLWTHRRLRLIAQYNDTKPSPGPNNLFLLVSRRLKMQGFLVFDHRDLIKQFYTDMPQWIREGKSSGTKPSSTDWRTRRMHSSASSRARIFGKMLVKIGPDPGGVGGG